MWSRFPVTLAASVGTIVVSAFVSAAEIRPESACVEGRLVESHGWAVGARFSTPEEAHLPRPTIPEGGLTAPTDADILVAHAIETRVEHLTRQACRAKVRLVPPHDVYFMVCDDSDASLDPKVDEASRVWQRIAPSVPLPRGIVLEGPRSIGRNTFAWNQRLERRGLPIVKDAVVMELSAQQAFVQLAIIEERNVDDQEPTVDAWQANTLCHWMGTEEVLTFPELTVTRGQSGAPTLAWRAITTSDKGQSVCLVDAHRLDVVAAAE